MDKICQICSLNHQSNEAKYKCPSCFLKYCSLECWKEHRKVGCSKTSDSKPSTDSIQYSVTPTPFLAPTDDTIKDEVLEKLRDSEKLKSLLGNPELRQLLVEVDRSKYVKQAIEQAMLEESFVEFADTCLEVVEPQQSEK